MRNRLLDRIVLAGDGEHEDLRRLRRADVAREEVTRAGRLVPRLAGAIGPRGRAFDLRFDMALRDVGEHRSLVHVRLGRLPRRERHGGDQHVLAGRFRNRLLHDRGDGFACGVVRLRGVHRRERDHQRRKRRQRGLQNRLHGAPLRRAFCGTRLPGDSSY
ncbi:hypothetical protein PT2222_70219 [Paraburkholderia tropica]